MSDVNTKIDEWSFTRIGSLLIDLSKIHKFFLARVMPTYSIFNCQRRQREVDEHRNSFTNLTAYPSKAAFISSKRWRGHFSQILTINLSFRMVQ